MRAPLPLGRPIRNGSPVPATSRWSSSNTSSERRRQDAARAALFELDITQGKEAVPLLDQLDIVAHRPDLILLMQRNIGDVLLRLRERLMEQIAALAAVGLAGNFRDQPIERRIGEAAEIRVAAMGLFVGRGDEIDQRIERIICRGEPTEQIEAR